VSNTDNLNIENVNFENVNVGAMNTEVVMQFIAAWSKLDFGALKSAVSHDIFYQNIPYAAIANLEDLRQFGDSVAAMVGTAAGGMPITPIVGLPAFSNFLETIKQFDWARWDVKSIAADKEMVFTERVDTFGFGAGGSISVGVIGLFQVREGLIHTWRDLFNLQEFQSQMQP
jgi:limonene-1,2-epoxide hydrolase